MAYSQCRLNSALGVTKTLVEKLFLLFQITVNKNKYYYDHSDNHEQRK